MIFVSSCLCGEKCKYSGGDNYNEAVVQFVKEKTVVKVCPEVLGGLPIPREPAEIVGGSAKDVLNGNAKILNCKGEDVTAAFINGAQAILSLARQNHVKFAILKANSPSCGKGKVYDGHFCGQLINGNGIFAELLIQEGIEVKTEEEI